MTRPTARVLALLEALQSGGTRTVSDLAARLEVDERTVRRYGKDGLLDERRIGPRLVRVTEASVDAMLRKDRP